MQKKHAITPNYIFETSWEVCNKVGGIYTVLSSRACSMQHLANDKVFFIGPDIWGENAPLDFEPSTDFSPWVNAIKEQGISVKIGRWAIEGRPYAILVDFQLLYAQKDAIYSDFWHRFGVDSLHAYGDYDESSLFGYASGLVIKSFYEFHNLDNSTVVAHFNEWMTAFGLLYLKAFLPQVATLFTTHATTVGRSIAGNGKPLYDYMQGYYGDQMACELNVQSKHSAEKAAAHQADCFTTVSAITNIECEQLLEKPADIITPNGFEFNVVPQGTNFLLAREQARRTLFSVAEKWLGYPLNSNTLFIGTSGRYEYKNKGIDLFIESLHQLSTQKIQREVVALIMVPAWVNNERMKSKDQKSHTYDNRYALCPLMDSQNDHIMQALHHFGFDNTAETSVKVLFAPIYISPDDGIFNCSYYNLLIGLDLTLFPSYYEPWGYTPMESAAFAVPTITTDLAGFGRWISDVPQSILQGIGVIHRNDSNYDQAVSAMTEELSLFINQSNAERERISKQAENIARSTLWTNFFIYYQEAYALALYNNSKNNRH